MSKFLVWWFVVSASAVLIGGVAGLALLAGGPVDNVLSAAGGAFAASAFLYAIGILRMEGE